MVVLVVEPEEVSLTGFVDLGDPDGHAVLGCFFESVLLFLNNLLVVEPVLIHFFLALQLLLVVRYYLALLGQLLRDTARLKNFSVWLIRHTVHQVNVLHPQEVAVRHKAS